jgi:hypothetical protein
MFLLIYDHRRDKVGTCPVSSERFSTPQFQVVVRQRRKEYFFVHFHGKKLKEIAFLMTWRHSGKCQKGPLEDDGRTELAPGLACFACRVAGLTHVLVTLVARLY